jgi:fumarate reductase subunit C
MLQKCIAETTGWLSAGSDNLASPACDILDIVTLMGKLYACQTEFSLRPHYMKKYNIGINCKPLSTVPKLLCLLFIFILVDFIIIRIGMPL